MEDEFDLELGEHAFEDAPIENRSGDLAVDFRRDRRIELRQIERHDCAIALLGELLNQARADLAAGTRDEHDRFAHGENYTEPS